MEVAMQVLADPKTWTDEYGAERRVPSRNRLLDCPGVALHAALRAYVHRRDNFTCQHCGRQATKRIKGYDGRYAILCDGDPPVVLVLDHKLSRRNGGTHHPDNLQILCDSCNARKVATHDRFGIAG